MKACKPITKESSQKFTDGRSKKEGYSFLRPVLTLNFQNKPRRVWGWRAGSGVGRCCYIGERISYARVHNTHTHTHTHTHTSWLQESRKLQEWNRIAGKQQTWPLMVNGGIWKTHWISCWKSLGKEFRFDVLLSLPLVAALLDNVFVL